MSVQTQHDEPRESPPAARSLPAWRANWPLASLLALLGVQAWLVWWTFTESVAGTMHVAFTGDVRARFGWVATAVRPWVEQQVEFPPLAVLVIEPLKYGIQPEGWLAIHLLIQTTLHVATAAAMAWGFGQRGLRRYLFWSAPMLPIVLLRLDQLSLLFVVLTVVLVRRGRDVAAGWAIVAGVFSKVWPGLLAVTLARRHRVSAGVGIAGSVVLTLVWMALTSRTAPVQVLGFRGATGWHIESVAGTIVRLVDGGEAEMQSGAWRFGDASWLLTAVLGLVALAITWWAAGRLVDPGRQLLVGLCVLLIAAPLLSVQYAAWVAIALALAETRWSERALGLVVLVASYAVLWWIGGAIRAEGLGWWVLLVRNVALVGLAVELVRHTVRGPEPAPPPLREPVGVPA